MSDGIMSPPYPSETTNSRMLYRHIAAMRAWVVEQQEVLRPLVPAKFTESLVEPPTMESVTFWDNVSIIDKHTVLMWIRKIRETWDILLRQHEDAWDTKFALFQRYSVVHSAMMVLTQAFVDPKTREFNQEKALAKIRQRQALMDKHLRDVLIPDEIRDDVEREQANNLDIATEWFSDDDNQEPGEYQPPEDVT